ncbi:MAG: phosphonate ABC transporter ATP-binding protein [Haloechinothrix sp.]
MSESASVELRGVGVGYGDTVALADIDLTIEPGEQVAVIGPSGAGKSTLIGVLNGTVPVTTGAVRLLGRDTATATRAQLRAVQRRIGTIHQRFDLVDQLRTVHNVNAGRLGSWPFWKAAMSLLVPLDVHHARSALERVGIADKLHERTGDLSGGEQQRVAIGRVLVQRPEIILADEPVASLDPARGKEVMSLLLDLSAAEGTTLLTSLHDVDMALDKFHRVIGVRAGRILFDKPRSDLRDVDLRALYAFETVPGPR